MLLLLLVCVFHEKKNTEMEQAYGIAKGECTKYTQQDEQHRIQWKKNQQRADYPIAARPYIEFEHK